MSRIQMAGLMALGLMTSSLVAAQTPPDSLPPQKILSVVTADWNKDGGFDRAVLYEGDEDAGLLIYLSDNDKMGLSAFMPNAAWTGRMWGSTPELTRGLKDSLKLMSQNTGIGRNKWTQTLTLVYRPGGFVVGGFTYDSYDTLDQKNSHSCDINLLTGKGLVGKKSVKVAPVTIKITDWNEDKVPQPCRF